MNEDMKQAAIWLRGERRRLGASANLVARLSTLIASRAGDPVRIHQQQISDLENVDEGRGPRSLRPWFRHVRAAFDSGLIADALGHTSAAHDDHSPERIAGDADRNYSIQDQSGRLVGRLTLFGQAAR